MPRSIDPPPLSEAMLEIMNIVWDNDEVTVAKVWSVLSARRKVGRNSIQTMLSRLEERRWITHRAEGQTFFYREIRPRQTVLRQMVRRLVDTAFAGSADGLVVALLEDPNLSRQEAERIRKLISDAKAGGDREESS